MELIFYIVGVFVVIDILFAIYIIFFRKKKLAKREILKIKKHVLTAKALKQPESVILEMDKIVDDVLSRLGYSGKFGDKLRSSKKLFSDYNGIWEAHKLRNKVAHEIGYKIGRDQLGRALRQYDRALRDLGIL